MSWTYAKGTLPPHYLLGFEGPKPRKADTQFSLISCYESHPEITLGAGKLRGGSCINPIVSDFDIYVALQSNAGDLIRMSWPWLKPEEMPILFPIPDMGVPESRLHFNRMITHLAERLDDGKKVHVGCIGGHGRSGMVIAALVKTMTGEQDAITWTRKNYCKKAVETAKQVAFLHDVFGIKKCEGSKEGALRTAYDYPKQYYEVPKDVDFDGVTGDDRWKKQPSPATKAAPGKLIPKAGSITVFGLDSVFKGLT